MTYAKQKLHCLLFKQHIDCQPYRKIAGILESWNHVVLQQKYIILYISISIYITTTTSTLPISHYIFCDSSPVPKFQPHFTYNEISPIF